MNPNPCTNCTNMNHPGMTCQEMQEWMDKKLKEYRAGLAVRKGKEKVSG